MAVSNPLNIIIPALDEATVIARTLGRLQPARRAGCRVTVVDGGSIDATVALASPLADSVVRAEPGRALQLNVGAAATQVGDFWFVHADTLVDPGAWRDVRQALATSESAWGRFDLRLSGSQVGLTMVAKFINWRSRWSGIATGDQGIFITRGAFHAAGGFPEQPLMEDIELSRRLKRICAPVCLRKTIETSARRWEQRGLLRTILTMWVLRSLYSMGASPVWLASRYANVRE